MVVIKMAELRCCLRYSKSLIPKFFIGLRDFLGVTVKFDFAIFDENGAITEFDNVFHRVSD